MTGLTDERDALRGQRLGKFDRERKASALTFDLHPPQDRVGTPLDFFGKVIVTEREQCIGLVPV